MAPDDVRLVIEAFNVTSSVRMIELKCEFKWVILRSQHCDC